MITIKSFGSGSHGNCALVENEKTKILLDCGFPIQKIIKNLSSENILITDLDMILCTHFHQDHIMAINHLSDYDIPIYCSQQTIEKFNLIGAESLMKIKRIKVETIDIIPLRIEHGDCECYGFIFHDKDSLILFITDFMLMEHDLSEFPFDEIYIEINYCEDKMENALNKAQTSDLETIKLKRQINTHTSLENALKYLKRMNLTNCKKIVGIHLSRELANINNIKERLNNELNIPSYCLNSKGELI